MAEAPADIRLFISVISARQWPAQFGESLAVMMLHHGLKRLDGRLAQHSLRVSRQAHPSVTRNSDIIHALAEGFTHFLSLDDDQTFPPDVVERMLSAEKPIVTANYRKKTMDVQYVCSGLDGQMLDSTHRAGLERIKMMGMGMALIDLAALKDIPAPYFGALWNADTANYVIEDEFFCRLLWHRGVEIWCDHDLSRQVGHVGEYEYRLPPLTPDLTVVESAPPQQKVA